MKKSEARILVFIDKTPSSEHYARKINIKLEGDYNYTLQILAGMYEKEWLMRSKSQANPTRTYYKLTQLGREGLKLAEGIVSGDKKNEKRN